MSEDAPAPALSDDQARVLAAVLDTLIPPSEDGRLPGAGELGLAVYVEQALQQAPALLPLITRGLAILDDLARPASPAGFAALPQPGRAELLTRLSESDPGFLPGLLYHTYAGYYQSPRVVEALGLEARPPYPEGYAMEPTDFRLLDAVRRRPKLYRA